MSILPEVENYLQVIESVRGQVKDLVADLPPEALNWCPLAGDDHATNSLAVITTHIAGSEHFWIGEVVGRHPATRIRESEFVALVDNTTLLINLLDKVGQETRQVLTALTPYELTEIRQARKELEVSVRWAILHVIEHTALHLGHLQITKQLWLDSQHSAAGDLVK